MAFPATPYSAWSINRRINPSYSGNLIQISIFDGSTQNFHDIGFDANGEIDRQAIINAVNNTVVGTPADFREGSAYLLKVYDQYLSNDLSIQSEPGKFTNLLYNRIDGVFTEDTNGFLKAYKSESFRAFETGNNLQGIATASFHYRGAIYPDNGDGALTPVNSPIVAGAGNDAAYAGWVENSTTTSINASMGTPTFANNGVALSVTQRQDLFNAYADGVLRTIGINNLNLSAKPITNFEFPSGRYDYIYQHDFQEAVLYNSDQSANNSTINEEFEAYYEPAPIPSVTFTDAFDVPIVGADVTWIAEDPFVATDPQWTNAQVVGSNYVTDGQGVATYDPTTDPAVDKTKVYTAIARYLEWDGVKWVPTMGAITAQNNIDLTPPA